jgi:hypothetical protein
LNLEIIQNLDNTHERTLNLLRLPVAGTILRPRLAITNAAYGHPPPAPPKKQRKKERQRRRKKQATLSDRYRNDSRGRKLPYTNFPAIDTHRSEKKQQTDILLLGHIEPHFLPFARVVSAT